MRNTLAYLVGALADGSIYHSKRHYVYRVSYYQKLKRYLAECIEPCIFQLFGKRGYYYFDKRKSVYYYVVTSKAVYQKMNEAVGSFKSSKQRSVPQWITDGDKAVQQAFIRGFFDADGFYYMNPKASDYRVRFGQSEQTVLEDVRNILHGTGFKCSDVLGPYKSKSYAKPYYELHIHGQNQVYKFHNLIKPCHPNKQLDSPVQK